MWNANQIQGVNVTSGATTGQVLQYNGTNWAASTLSNYTPGTGLSLSGNTLNSIWTNSSNNVSNNTGNTLSFLTSSKPRMHIDANGDIGIGGNSTGAKLFLKHGNKSAFDSSLGLYNIYGQHILGDSVIAYNGSTQVGTIGQKIVVRKNMNLNLGTFIDVGSNNSNSSVYPANYGIYSAAQAQAKNGYNLGGAFIASGGLYNNGVFALSGLGIDSLNSTNTAITANVQGKGATNTGISLYATVPVNNPNQYLFGINSSLTGDGIDNYIMGFQETITSNAKGAYIHGKYIGINAPADSTFIYGQRMDIRTSTGKGSNIYANDLYASMESTGNLLGYDGDLRHSGINSQVYGFNQYVQLTGAGTIGFGYSADLRAYAKGNRNYAIDAFAAGSNNSDENYGIYSYATNGAVNYAGYFVGNVHVNGALSKSSGSFKIDHPADPENKYLVHSFVESPDMMNIYNGNVVTDANGDATIIMPDYFEALNMDFRYQLTCMGVFAQAMVAQKIEGNRFVIKTDKPNVEVSWQVTGVRQDPWANAHRIEPVVTKSETERGTYLNPELYGKPETSRLGYHEPKKVEAVKPQIAPTPQVALPTVKSKP
ncbi:MAG: hypothetical protein IT244_00720 [Bacteroidia bacterium]|nr:hypothetical protein [Bacteroidia bacterium]